MQIDWALADTIRVFGVENDDEREIGRSPRESCEIHCRGKLARVQGRINSFVPLLSAFVSGELRLRIPEHETSHSFQEGTHELL